MTLPIWPDTLPLPVRAAYQAQPFDVRRRKTPDQGPPAYRRSYSQVPRTMAMQIAVGRSLKASFDRFFDETTSAGSVPFWMPDPVTDGWALLGGSGQPLSDGSGTPILLSARLLCLFGDELPSETLRGVTFTIAFQVTVLP